MYLTQGLHRALQQQPDTTAIWFQDRQYTFREFGDRVARLAGALQALGLRPDDRVAILSLNSDRYLEYYLAVPWAGGVLNPCNIRWSVAEIVYSLNDSESSILLVDEAFKDSAAEICAKAPSIRDVIYTGDGATPGTMHNYQQLLASTEPVADSVRRDDDLAGLFYTGGTTGFPKGVMLSHTNLCSSAIGGVLAENLLPSGCIYLHAPPMFHIADFAAMLGQFLRGGKHVVIPAFEPVLAMQQIERHQVTDTLLVPTMVQMLVDHPALQEYNLSSLQRVIYGASPISAAVLERAMKALPQADFIQAYGMTELAPMATILSAYYHTPAGQKADKIRAAGRACCHIELKIVDAEDNEVPLGTVGEVAARGPNVMLGYWRKPAETEAALRGGWMHTGDGAYMDEDGFIYIVDRMKDMIISGGENIYSTEVENAVAKHPAVAVCAVIGIPSEEWGESVHAVIVAKEGMADEITVEAIRSHCRELIAGYKCPRSLELRDSLPLSGAGKVLKTALREPFWQGAERGIN